MFDEDLQGGGILSWLLGFGALYGVNRAPEKALTPSDTSLRPAGYAVGYPAGFPVATSTSRGYPSPTVTNSTLRPELLLPAAPLSPADKIYQDARALEPEVTAFIKSFARALGGELINLDFRIKSLESITRKLKKIGDTRISDALRYTMLFPTETYTPKVLESMQRLKDAGYEVISRNYWQPGDKYQGVNANLIKDGVTMELQFHTPESFASVAECHVLYEEFREIPTKPDGSFAPPNAAKARAIYKQIADKAARIPIPEGWEKIPGRRFDPFREES